MRETYYTWHLRDRHQPSHCLSIYWVSNGNCRAEWAHHHQRQLLRYTKRPSRAQKTKMAQMYWHWAQYVESIHLLLIHQALVHLAAAAQQRHLPRVPELLTQWISDRACLLLSEYTSAECIPPPMNARCFPENLDAKSPSAMEEEHDLG